MPDQLNQYSHCLREMLTDYGKNWFMILIDALLSLYSFSTPPL
jgi:hypothetical protein